MDEDDQRELAELRRRAYGPGGGLTDPVAIARLEELEERARPVPAAAAAPVPGGVPTRGAASPTSADRAPDAAAGGGADPGAGGAAAGGADATGDPAGASASAAIPPPVRTPRRRLFVSAAVVVAIAVLAAIVVPRLVDTGPSLRRSEPGPLSTPTGILATPESVHRALRYAEDPEVESILTIQLGRALALPTPEPVPDLPVEGDAAWIETVGDYYGQRVWLARAASGEVCLLVEGATVTRGACLDEEEFELDALLITVPYLEVPADDRPDAMQEGDALSFWWRSDDRLAVLVGPSPFAVD